MIPYTTSKIIIHAMASCWKTLFAQIYFKCLANASLNLPSYLPSIEDLILNSICLLRDSDYEFLDHSTIDQNDKGN